MKSVLTVRLDARSTLKEHVLFMDSADSFSEGRPSSCGRMFGVLAWWPLRQGRN